MHVHIHIYIYIYITVSISMHAYMMHAHMHTFIHTFTGREADMPTAKQARASSCSSRSTLTGYCRYRLGLRQCYWEDYTCIVCLCVCFFL